MSDYSDDIDKYLSGQLTPAQMNALEKKALNDPFLADALQGLGSIEPDQLQADIHDIKGRLARQTRKELASWKWISRIAAALIIVAVATFVVIFLSDRQGDNGNLALNKNESQAPEQQSPPIAATPADTISPAQTEVPEEKKEPVGPPIAAKPEADTRSRSEQPAAKAPVEQDRLADAEVAEDMDDIDAKISEALSEENRTANAAGQQSIPSESALEAQKKQELFRDRAETERDSEKRKSVSGARVKESAASYNVARKIVRGRVTYSEDGTGLPGVNILVKGSNEGVVTDAKGNYQISVEGQPTLQFSFIGFSTTEVPATSDELNVSMSPDISELSEVVVVGYSDDVGFLPSTPTVMELAAPEGGRRMYKQYLEQNLQYPQLALENKVEGKVTVQFTIDMMGQMTDFRVIKGLGFGCEEEVIRLIKQGPKWSPTKKNEAPIKDRVRVRMRFSLPKK